MYKSYQSIFDQRAGLYHGAMQLAPAARDREFQLAVDYLALSGRERVLDMPAGGGYLQPYIQKFSCELYSMETSLAFAHSCRSQFSVNSVLGSFVRLPLIDDCMDRVLCLAALHHVEEREAFFKECHRILADSGIMVLADVESRTRTARFLNEFVDQYNSMGHEGRFLSDEESKILGSCGFQVSHDELHEFHWRFHSEQQMLNFCRGLFGIDLADDATLKAGIREFLTPVYGEDSVRLCWQLRYLTLTKA